VRSEKKKREKIRRSTASACLLSFFCWSIPEVRSWLDPSLRAAMLTAALLGDAVSEIEAIKLSARPSSHTRAHP
jgi:hypothetical protein